MEPDYWVVRRRDDGWECRHCPEGTATFDDRNIGVHYRSCDAAIAVVPREYTQAIGPFDPEHYEESVADVSFYRPGDWEKLLNDCRIDPAEWFSRNTDHWIRPSA